MSCHVMSCHVMSCHAMSLLYPHKFDKYPFKIAKSHIYNPFTKLHLLHLSSP